MNSCQNHTQYILEGVRYSMWMLLSARDLMPRRLFWGPLKLTDDSICNIKFYDNFPVSVTQDLQAVVKKLESRIAALEVGHGVTVINYSGSTVLNSLIIMCL